MGFDAIGIVSADIGQSIKFYELLGLSFEAQGGDEHWEAITPSGLRLMLDTEDLVKKLNPNWQNPKGSRIVLCFKQDSAQLVDSVYEKMSKAGFAGVKEQWDAFWGQRYASVNDPDGNQVDLFADLP